MLEKLITKLSEELEIPTVLKNPKDLVQVFPFRNDLSLFFYDLNPGVCIQGEIGACPETKREEFLTVLARANLLGQGTGGARIGMKEDEKTLTLLLGMPYELSYDDFRNGVEDFVNYLVYWREELKTFKK